MVIIKITGWVRTLPLMITFGSPTDITVEELKVVAQAYTGVRRGTYSLRARLENGGLVPVQQSSIVGSLPMNEGKIQLEPTWNGKEF